MTTMTFEVLVDVLNCVHENNAIATASAYLAYADQSDTFGYNPRIESATVRTDLEDKPLGVWLTFSTGISNDDHLKEFMDEMATLAKVQSVERVV